MRTIVAAVLATLVASAICVGVGIVAFEAGIEFADARRGATKCDRPCQCQQRRTGEPIGAAGEGAEQDSAER